MKSQDVVVGMRSEHVVRAGQGSKDGGARQGRKVSCSCVSCSCARASRCRSSRLSWHAPCSALLCVRLGLAQVMSVRVQSGWSTSSLR